MNLLTYRHTFFSRFATGSCLLLLAVSPVLGGAPASISLMPRKPASTPVSFSALGYLAFEVGGKIFFIAPQAVDASSGKWLSPKIVSPFAAEEGTQIDALAKLQWEEGATVDLTLQAEIKGNTLNVRLSWKLDGDSPGHIRADILASADIASQLTVEQDGGGPIFKDGEVGKLVKAPVNFVNSADGAKFFTVEGEGLTVSAYAMNLEKQGCDIRFAQGSGSPGAKTMLSTFDSMEFSIVFP